MDDRPHLKFSSHRFDQIMALVGGSPRDTTRNVMQLRNELSQAANAASATGDPARAIRLRNGALRLDRAARKLQAVPLSAVEVPEDVRDDIIGDLDAGLESVDEFHRPGRYHQR